MPTGYTADLEKRNFDVKSWLKESVIRAMGVCISLRDNGDMNAKDIAAALKKEAEESYHARKLLVAKVALAEWKAMDPGQLKKLYEKEKREAKKAFEKRKKEHDEKMAKHSGAILDVESLIRKADPHDELTMNTLNFALEQLRSAFKFDYSGGPWREEILDQTAPEWAAARRKQLDRDVEYHDRELAAEDKRTSGRASEYERYVAWVDSALD